MTFKELSRYFEIVENGILWRDLLHPLLHILISCIKFRQMK